VSNPPAAEHVERGSLALACAMSGVHAIAAARLSHLAMSPAAKIPGALVPDIR
jgi:hypothetical protein